MLRMNFPRRKQKRQEEALIRQQLTNKLSSKQRLKLLDISLGVNVGAIKERIRLNNLSKDS